MSVIKNLVVPSILFVTVSCGDSNANPANNLKSMAAVDAASDQRNIVEVAAAAGQFRTLLSAAAAAGLVDTLATSSPLTVFAPTDEAFERLPEGLLKSLLDDKEKLRDVLLYHVLVGNAVDSQTAKGLTDAETANAKSVEINFSSQQLFINNSKVISPDILAKNGIIHAIDRVLLPPGLSDRGQASLFQLIESDDNFDILESYLRATKLDKTLDAFGSYSVFAPTDEAFLKLPRQTRQDLLRNPDQLKRILLFHVLGEKRTLREILGYGRLTTLLRRAVEIDGESLLINDSRILAFDKQASNGIIHVIDSVLIPPSH